MTYATLTGRITLHHTSTGEEATLAAYPATTGNALVFPTEDRITIGVASIRIGSDGTLLEPLKIPLGGNPSGHLWTLVYVPDDRRQRPPVDLGTYEITGDADIAELITNVAPVEVTPAWMAQWETLTIEAQVAALEAGEARDEARDLSQIDTPDALVGALVDDDASVTAARVNARLATELETDGSPANTVLKDQIGGVVYDVTDAASGLADASAAFIAAAVIVDSQGRKNLRVAPGAYHVPGLHPDDILDCYVIGDGVTLTGTPSNPPNLYPFTTAEFAGRSALAGTDAGGRGVLAIELDDALPEHWTGVFPIAKELGVTIGTAWHTDNGARWITEAHRHGWEVISHLPANTPATSVTLAELEAMAVDSLDKIEEAIGTREGIGFVYPQHVRTPETDRVLSKYFTRGRGLAGKKPYPRGQGAPWLTTAMNIDEHFTGGALSESLKATLRQVAAGDGQIVVYFHYNTGTAALWGQAFRELIGFARHLGMQIKNPGQVWGGTQMIGAPYDSSATWAPVAPAERVATDSYHGSTSIRLPAATSAGVDIPAFTVVPRDGMFTVLRAHCRVKTTGYTTTGGGNGIGHMLAEQMRKMDGTVHFGGHTPFGLRLPASGTTQPASNWAAKREMAYLQPATIAVAAKVASLQIASGEAFIDEVKYDLIGYTPSVTFTGTLIGAGLVYIRTGIPSLARCGITITPADATTGRITYSVIEDLLRITTATAGDNSPFKVTVTPGPAYYDMALSADGA